jgi:hypothetical protein
MPFLGGVFFTTYAKKGGVFFTTYAKKGGVFFTTYGGSFSPPMGGLFHHLSPLKPAPSLA